MDNLERKHKHEYSNDAYLGNFVGDYIAQTSQGKQRKHEMGDDWRAIITVTLVCKKPTRRGKTNRKQQLFLACGFEVCSHMFNFMVIGH